MGSLEGWEQTVDYRSGRQGRESYGVKVPCRQLPDSARLVYPGHGEVTNRGVLGSKSHGCSVLLVWNCGGSDLGGEQTWGPEHNEMTAASLTVPYRSRCAGKCGSRPSCNLGKADVLWEETGICTIGSHRGKGPGT